MSAIFSVAKLIREKKAQLYNMLIFGLFGLNDNFISNIESENYDK